jgi:hypothetical protein
MYADTNTNGSYDAGTDVEITYLDQVAADASKTVFVVADVPLGRSTGDVAGVGSPPPPRKRRRRLARRDRPRQRRQHVRRRHGLRRHQRQRQRRPRRHPLRRGRLYRSWPRR